MADSKGTARARRPGGAPRVVAPRNNKVTIALPLSMIRTGEPGGGTAGDWLGLAAVAVSAIGFGVVIAELIRIAHALEAGQARQAGLDPDEASPAEASRFQPA
jgi:hypothetical protein